MNGSVLATSNLPRPHVVAVLAIPLLLGVVLGGLLSLGSRETTLAQQSEDHLRAALTTSAALGRLDRLMADVTSDPADAARAAPRFDADLVLLAERVDSLIYSAVIWPREVQAAQTRLRRDWRAFQREAAPSGMRRAPSATGMRRWHPQLQLTLRQMQVMHYDAFDVLSAERRTAREVATRRLAGLLVVILLAGGLLAWWVLRRWGALDGQRAADQRALAEREAMLRVVLDGAFDGIVLADTETQRLLYGNAAMGRLLGVPPEEITTLGIADLHSPAVLASLGDHFARLMLGTPDIVRDVELLRRDGTTMTVDISATMVNRAGRPHFVGVFRDVTEQRRVEALTRFNEERLREAQRLAQVGSWELDLGANVLHCSDETYRIFEIDPSAGNTTYEGFLRTVHPDDRAAVNDAYTASLAQRGHYRVTHRLRLPDGRVKWVEERGDSDFTADGVPVRSRGTVQDITARVEAEQALRRTVAEKDVLLREVHHRVKNNLQVVGSLLYFHAKRVSDPEARLLFEDVRTRLRSLMLVHEQLYRAGDLARVAFDSYVRQLVVQMSDSAAAVPGAVRFAVSTEPVLLPIESAVPAGMILVELVSNVLKYAYPTDAGGAATVSLSEAGGRVALTVEDQGCGLPPGFDSASARSFGWQLIRQLAEQLNGAVTVAGGTGTRVRLDFPASPASPVEPQSPPRA